MEVIKSSRFWLALGVLISIAIFCVLGKLGAETAAGYLMAILAGFGVGKAGGASVKALLPLALCLSLSGCASWQQSAKTSLDASGAAAEGAKTIGDAHWATKCEAAAKTCGCAPLPAPCPCPQLVQCQSERRAFHTALLSLHGARVLGYTAIASCNESGSKTVIARIKELATSVARALKAAGVL